MRFTISFLLVLFLPLSVSAQNTQIPDDSLTSPTVTVEARVVQIMLNDEHRQGVDWEAIVSDFHSLQLKKEDNPVWADKKYKLSVGEVSNEDYVVLLDALDTVGRMSQTDVAPVMFKKDELKTVDVSPNSKVMPGMSVDLMWFNSPAGESKLKIEPAIHVILKNSSQPARAVILKAQTQEDLKDNTTVVIGGLMREEEIIKTHKFPLLGDLPLLGLVFRKQGKLMQKIETIIFLTMHTNSVQMPMEEQ